MADTDFSWYSKDSLEDIVFPSVQAVAVYQNEAKDVVIRQQGSQGEDDSIIVIPARNVEALVYALQEAAAPIL